MKAAGLPSGTLYPMLARLEDQKLVTSAWETPQAGGDRPRRYYQLTGEGIRVAWLCRRRGARRGGVGKNGVLKSAHWLGVRAALLVGLAILLAAQAFLVYQIIFGESLAIYVAFVLGYLAILAVCLFRRRPGGSTFSEYGWFGAGVVVAATGLHVNALAGHLGTARRDRRSGMQARSDRGQLGAPGGALGMSGQPRGWPGYASRSGPFAGAA